MTFLDKLFKRQATAHREGIHANAAGGAECPHLAIAPRWDRAEDIGHEDRATSFVCDSCHQTLDPSQAERIRSAAANRIRLG